MDTRSATIGENNIYAVGLCVHLPTYGWHGKKGDEYTKKNRIKVQRETLEQESI